MHLFRGINVSLYLKLFYPSFTQNKNKEGGRWRERGWVSNKKHVKLECDWLKEAVGRKREELVMNPNKAIR